MIDVRIRLNDLDYSALWRDLSGMVERSRNQTPAFRRAAKIMLESVKHNFDLEGRPKWKPRARATVAGYLTEGKRFGKLLRVSGKLFRSIKSMYSSRSASVRSVGVKYAGIHEFGGTVEIPEIRPTRARALRFWSPQGIVFTRRVRAHSVHIPARPFLLIQEEDMDRIVDEFAAHNFGRRR